MENMENFLQYAPFQWDAVSHILVFGVGATVAGLVYFLATAHLVAPKYRTSSYLSAVVMVSAAIILFNQQQSWDQAFVFNGSNWVSSYQHEGVTGDTGYTFSNGYRYLNWAIDVPMLLLQILFVITISSALFRKLAITFVACGLLMIGTSYVAQFFEYGFNPANPDGGAKAGFWIFYILGWIFYLIILVAIYRGVFADVSYMPERAARTMRGIWWLFLVSWTMYGVAIAIPAFAWSSHGGVWRQYIFTIADVLSKVIYGVMLTQVATVRSAEDGYEPAMRQLGLQESPSRPAA